MQITGNVEQQGYAWIRNLLPVEITRAFMSEIKRDFGQNPIALSRVEHFPNLLNRAALDLYGNHYRPMLFMLWGLTPVMSNIVGKELLPSYDYFRIYREGDICKVHCDRYACEYSLSLTLDYSDGVPWPLDVATRPVAPSSAVSENFGELPYASVPMEIGDAVLYRGVQHRHGRLNPNPNGWSAHLFLHWVDRHGDHAAHAFDGQKLTDPVNFTFA